MKQDKQSIGDVFNEKIRNFLNRTHLFSTDDDIEKVVPTVRNYLITNLPRFKNDLIDTLKFDFKFENLPDLIHDHPDENTRINLFELRNVVLTVLLQNAGIFLDRPEILEKPVEWFDDAFEGEDAILFYRYLDLFLLLINKM